MATPSSGGGGAGAGMQGRKRGGGRCGENMRRATRVLVPVPLDLLWRAETNVFDADFNLKHFDGETALQLV